MADLLSLYEQQLASVMTPEAVEQEKELKKTLLREAAEHLLADGMEPPDIQSGLRKFGQSVLRMDKTVMESLFDEILPKLPMQVAGMPKGNLAPKVEAACHAAIQQHTQELSDVYFEADKAALSRLMDDGYLPREIYNDWQDNNRFATIVRDSTVKNRYEDRIQHSLADERGLRVQKEKPEAEAMLKTFLSQNEHKYASGSDGISIFRNGAAALHLLQERKFLPDTVREVMEEQSPNLASRSDLLDRLMEKSCEVMRVYKDIQNGPDLEDASSPQEVYYGLARHRLERTKLKQLTYVDDRTIVKEMRELGFKEKTISQTLEQSSPIAREPGRDAGAYVATALAKDADLDAAIEKTITEKDFVHASDTYRTTINEFDAALRRKGYINGIGETNLRVYYDTLASRKLLKLHYSDQEIQEAIKGNSPNEETYRDHYASWIFTKAKNLIKKEQNLMRPPMTKLPAATSHEPFAELTKLGFSAFDLYQQVLHEKLAFNPSFASRLFDENIDCETVETCFVKYPDFDREAMEGILRDKSPRAELLFATGLPEEKGYAETVVSQVQHTMKEQENTVQEEESLLYEFNRHRGLAYQGVQAQDADPSYQFGKSALMLRLKGRDDLSVRYALLQSITPEMPITKAPEKFVDDIIERVGEVYQRLMRVKDWDSSKEEQKELDTAEKAYMDALHAQYLKHHAVRASMDIQIFREMLASEKFEKEQILAAIRTCSPIAAEPGRDGTYISEYLSSLAKTSQEQAAAKAAVQKPQDVKPPQVPQQMLQQQATKPPSRTYDAIQKKNERMEAKDRLRKEKPQPRENHRETAEEEYKELVEAMRQRHPSLPYDVQMDSLIAETMLMENFISGEIEDAINKFSPCKDAKEQEKYGERVVSYADNAFQKTYNKQTYADGSSKAVEHIYTRTYAGGMVTETDETTTTTTDVVAG